MEHAYKHGGADFELFARISEKNHAHSTLNPLATYQKRLTLDEIMNNVMVAYPKVPDPCARRTVTGPLAAGAGERLEAEDAVGGAALGGPVKISASVLTTDPWEEACQAPLPDVTR